MAVALWGHSLLWQQSGLPFDADAAPEIPESGAASPEYPPAIFVRHPRARRYVVSVREDGGVRVTLPRRGSMREARAFAGRLHAWIEKQRQRLQEARAARPVTPDDVQRERRAQARRELPPRLLEL